MKDTNLKSQVVDRPTMDQLRNESERIDSERREREESLKEKRWFAILPGDKFWDGSIEKLIVPIEDLEDTLSNFDAEKISAKVEFVYRTNKWFESKPEA